jgi:hypothetical protein
MFIYWIKYMRAGELTRGKNVYVADDKNEIIKFAILIA